MKEEEKAVKLQQSLENMNRAGRRNFIKKLKKSIKK